MRLLMAVLLLATLASGCTEGPESGSDDARNDRDDLSPDREDYRDGMVFFETEYSVNSLDPARFSVDVAESALDVILEIQQDAGMMPNLQVELSSCGQAQPASSGDWEAYLLCQEPVAGRQDLRVSIGGGMAATGSGRLLLRADLPIALDGDMAT